QQGFHQGDVPGFADQTEGAGVLFGHDAPSIGQIRGKVSRIQAPACGGRSEQSNEENGKGNAFASAFL
ncbi:MAG: hypothetical protein ACLU98_06885, partial [Desulfovibrio fairfieldensis]